MNHYKTDMQTGNNSIIFSKIDTTSNAKQYAQCLACGFSQSQFEFKLVGAHAMSRMVCNKCKKISYVDLPFCHSIAYPFSVIGEGDRLVGGDVALGWYGNPLVNALRFPRTENIDLLVEKSAESREIIFLPCIDYLYGHSLLKLLQVRDHIAHGEPVVVLVPKYLRWMVPEGVSEIWSVKLPLKDGKEYFPLLSEKIVSEFKRFDTVYLSPGRPHPSVRCPKEFTRVNPHNWDDKNFRISFIWRNDRLWVSEGLISKIIQKTAMRKKLEVFIQKLRIIHLMKTLKKGKTNNIKYTVVGIGNCPIFPKWIDVKIYPAPLLDDAELALCRIYSESRVVIGVHGSNMLLPSWHAGSTIDLMPKDRWGNFGQDILFRDENPRYAVIRNRFASISSSIPDLANQINSIILKFSEQLEAYK